MNIDDIDYKDFTAQMVEEYKYSKAEEATKETIDELDWNQLRSYASTAGIPIQGLKREIAVHVIIKETTHTTSGGDDIIEESIEDVNLTGIQQLTRKIRCRVIPHNPTDIAKGTLTRTVGNMEHGFAGGTTIVRFNEIVHLDAAVFEALKIQKYAVTDKQKDASGTVIEVSSKLADSFDIHVYPPLTARQLKELAEEQKAAEDARR